jgi:hypothetical protein
MRRTRDLALVAAFLVGSHVAGAQMLTANPCQLLTPTEVLAALQDSVIGSPILLQNQNPECTIITATPATRVHLKIEPTRDYDDAYWEAATAAQHPVTNLGDRASVTTERTGVTVLRVLRHGRVYTIIYDNPSMRPDEIAARETRLAGYALGRAP